MTDQKNHGAAPSKEWTEAMAHADEGVNVGAGSPPWTISAADALAVGKLLHGGGDDDWGICTYSDEREAIVVRGGAEDWTVYDPATDAECWAMARYIAGKTLPGGHEADRLHDAMGLGDVEELVALVIETGGKG